MRRYQVVGAIVGVVLGCCGSPVSSSSACGYHGTLGNGFSALHPASLSVAIALREAIDRGALKELKPVPSLAAFAQAGRRIEHVRRALAGAMYIGYAAPPIALLLVEPGLWTRYLVDAMLSVQMHAPGPSAGDVVVVTGEAVLQALIDRSVSVDRALADGLLVIAEHSDAAATALEGLTAVLSVVVT